MNKAEAQDRIEKLKTLINDYRYQYHVLDRSTMSEAAADSLKHELTQLEARYPELITSDSPTQRVAGIALKKFSQLSHSSRMLSLNDVFNAEEVLAWEARISKLLPDPGNRCSYFTDIKMDGLACALVYQDGQLEQAITRGDGFIGEDVTSNIRTIENIPLQLIQTESNGLFHKGRTEIRGEVVMYKADFAKLNQDRQAAGQPLFANPRNLAAGTIRQLDPKLAAARPLRFRAYDLLREDQADVPTNEFAYIMLRSLGITANQEATVFQTIKQVLSFANHWDAARHELPFNTDGLVVKLNDRAIFQQLGVVGKAPRAAIAYKYPAEEATTIVRDIILSIGRTGTANPVAVFEPVVVAGSTVQHATLHNAEEVARKDIRVGDTVIIYKAGDIIPQVLRVLPELRPAGTQPFNIALEAKRQYPELTFEQVPGEAAYRMKDTSGPLLLKRALEHYASKAALDIDTLGEKNVAALVDGGLVADLADLYSLDVQSIMRLDRFAKISAEKLVRGIQAKKHPVLSRFIYGLGIRHVGSQTAIDLSQAFGSLDALACSTIDQLQDIDGIGIVVAESIVAWFADQDNQALLQSFRNHGVMPLETKAPSGPLVGTRFVVTGTLSSMSRTDAKDMIEQRGGIMQASVAKDTDYLVLGDAVGAAKLKKARSYGITELSEAEFLDRMNQTEQ
jgi:DNA ligase (NAD+)